MLPLPPAARPNSGLIFHSPAVTQHKFVASKKTASEQDCGCRSPLSLSSLSLLSAYCGAFFISSASSITSTNWSVGQRRRAESRPPAGAASERSRQNESRGRRDGGQIKRLFLDVLNIQTPDILSRLHPNTRPRFFRKLIDC